MTEEHRFSSEIKVDPKLLRYTPFKEKGHRLAQFDSGEPELDKFLTTEEVEEYERDKLGSTTLVYYQGELVAFYTIGTDSLRLEYIDEKKLSGAHWKRGRQAIESIPSLKVGRLATDGPWQGKGIGRILIRRIGAIAYTLQPAVRLLTVNSKPKSVDFYLKCGFEFACPVKRERRRDNKTMWLDLFGILDQIEAEIE
jgi:GNAT superfamily N-acetyltransferase